MTLKLATAEDMPAIIEMAEKFAHASSYKDFPIEVEKIQELVYGLMRDKNKGVIVLYLHDNKPVGMIAGVLTEMIFSRETIASELIWWVNPEHRTRKSLSLKEAYEFWAKRVGAKYVQMSALVDEKIARFYTRTGYRLTEQAYLKVIGG